MIPDHEEGIRQLKYAYDKGINVSDDCCLKSMVSLTNRHSIRPMSTRMVNPRLS